MDTSTFRNVSECLWYEQKKTEIVFTVFDKMCLFALRMNQKCRRLNSHSEKIENWLCLNLQIQGFWDWWNKIYILCNLGAFNPAAAIQKVYNNGI